MSMPHFAGFSWLQRVYVPVSLRIHRWPIVMFSLISLTTIFWFRKGLPIGYGDTGLSAFFINPGYQLKQLGSVWYSAAAGGYPYATNITLYSTDLLFFSLKYLGLPVFLVQAIYFSLLQFVAMIGMYVLTLIAFPNHPNRTIVAVASAIFYCYNPIVLMNLWLPGNLSTVVLPFAPWLLVGVVLSFRLSIVPAIVFIGALFTLFSIAFVNPAFVVPFIVIAFLMWAVRALIGIRQREFSTVVRSALAWIGGFGLNFWWLLPMWSGISGFYQQALVTGYVINSYASAHASALVTNTASLLRLIPVALNTPIWAYKNPSWRFVYNSVLFRGIGIFIIVTFLVGLASDSTNRRWKLAFAGTSIIAFALSLGSQGPTGHLYFFMLVHIPFFQAFRDAASKFGLSIVLGLAPIIGLGVAHISTTTSKLLKRRWSLFHSNETVIAATATIIMIIISEVYAFPLWTGLAETSPIVIRSRPISSEISVPNYYSQVREYLSQHLSPSARVLALPLRPLGSVGFNWKYGYDGPDFTSDLYGADTVSFLFQGYFPATKLLSYMSQSGPASIVDAAGLLGVQYITVQGDVSRTNGNYGGATLTSPSLIENQLSSLGLKTAFRFGPIVGFQIPKSLTVPRIQVTAGKPILVKNYKELISTLEQNVSSPAITRSQGLLLGLSNPNAPYKLSSYIGSQSSPIFGKNLPTNIVRYSSTSWGGFFDSNGGDVTLAFGDNFNPNWKLSVKSTDPKGSTGAPIVVSHYLAGGFANGWQIRLNGVKGIVTFSIVYSPANQSHRGIIISIFAVAATISVGYAAEIRKRRNLEVKQL